MTNHDIKLYGYSTSPFVGKVSVFLKYKRIPFEFVPVNPVFPKRQLSQFPGQRRVPVLSIDGEWRGESTDLGIWLDEVVPERPILGDTSEDTDRILEMDRWVNDQLIMGRFRELTEWTNIPNALRNGWKLSRVIHESTPIPFVIRKAWPFIVRRAGFVRRFAGSVKSEESVPEMQQRQCRELVELIGQGPFLGGRSRVSLADLSAWCTIATPHLIGMHGKSVFLEDPDVLAWCRRVQAELPANPLVVPDHLIERGMP